MEMKKLLMSLFAALSLVLIAGGALAQKKDPKMTPKPGPVPATAAAGQPGGMATTTVKGIVKAAPSGKTFMIAQGKKIVTVDTSGGAKLRYKGKFFALDKL